MELVFSVTQEADGGFVAECLSEAIFTQADSWEDLKQMVADAVQGHFFDQPEKAKSQIRLHLVRDEVLAAR
jgi:predicted RNase H-like HicB family nuclease